MKAQFCHAVGICALLTALSACAATYRTHSLETLLRIERNSSAYVGQLYAFEGEVISVQGGSAGIAFRVMVTSYDRYNWTTASLFVVYGHGGTHIVRGHEVAVLGHIAAPARSSGTFGLRREEVRMIAIATANKGPDGRWQWRPSCSWLAKNEETYKQWASGKLFAPQK